VKKVKKYLQIILVLVVMSLVGCATTGDLKALRSEMNQKMDEKFSMIDADLSDLKKNVAALEAMRKGQANTAADISELRDNIQQLRGQIESLKKDLAAGSKKEDQRLDNILLKINFIENFLEIGGKTSSNDAGVNTNGSQLFADSSKTQDKEKAYSTAYKMFQDGHYDKARKAFQSFLGNYPDSEYSDNAQFWIGECYFFEQKYEAAILEYEKVTKNYPNGNKVSYALLKQGLSFNKLGDKTSAKLLLQQVIKNYPNTSQARIARSRLQEIK
jgi:tol-pal system protein YbgF